MFWIDPSTRIEDPVWGPPMPDFETYDFVKVSPNALVFLFEGKRSGAGSDAVVLRYMFTDLLRSLFVALAEGWDESSLDLMLPSEASSNRTAVLTPVLEIWECEPERKGRRSFEIATGNSTYHSNSAGRMTAKTKRFRRLWPVVRDG